MSCMRPQSSHDDDCLLTLCCLPLLTSDVYENVLFLWGGTETAAPYILRLGDPGALGSSMTALHRALSLKPAFLSLL